MKIIIGLGNPEQKYTATRHNLGFEVVAAVARTRDVDFKLKDKFHAHVSETQVRGEKALLVQPTTYYNASGESYHAIIDYYKVEPADVLIVHDELALPFGTIRSRIGGSDAGNNGIKSINQHGGEDAARIRVGISSEQRAVMGDTDFVLGRLSSDEQSFFNDTMLPKLISLVDEFIVEDHKITSHSLLPKLTE